MDKKQRNPLKITLLLITAVVCILLLVDVTQNISTNLKDSKFIGKTSEEIETEKIDDWEYQISQVQIDNMPVYQDPVEIYFSLLTPRKIAVLFTWISMNIILVVCIVYLLYRLAGFIIKLFNHDYYTGTKVSIIRSIKGVFIGLVYNGIHYFIAVKNPEGIFNIPINFYTWILNICIGLVYPVLGIYFVFHIVKYFYLKKKKEIYPIKRYIVLGVLIFLFCASITFVRAIVGNLSGANIAVSDVTIGGSPGVSYKNVTSTGLSGPSIGKKMQAPVPAGGRSLEVDENIGLSTGGAKDINNFRENIKNSYLPLPTDVTYEGLFYDYYFDTGIQKECNELFCPAYSYAYTKDPFSQTYEEYITVGLNSGIKESDFSRKKLNIVVVLDISGSMSSPFNRYYYDQFGNRVEREDDGADYTKTKMQVATESVVAMLDHLKTGDRLGIVLFDNTSYIAKPINLVEETDMQSIKNHILELQPRGGTNMEAGLKTGTSLISEYTDVDRNVYENRLIFLTDAQPNTGAISSTGLAGITENNASEKIYTTFVGIGVDFNTDLIEKITKIKGANYYSVHNSKEFSYRMDEGFDYMVTPLVFDLTLKLESSDYEIENVFGTPEADESTGEILRVNTLFPSDSEGGEVKGGIILVRLKRKPDAIGKTIKLSANYTDRQENPHSNIENIILPEFNDEKFDNTGIRKAILLTRYTNLLKNWTLEERKYVRDPGLPIDYTLVNEEYGIIVPPERYMLSEWERQSIPLRVNTQYLYYFETFKTYFESEMTQIGDDTLINEVDVLNILINN